MIGVNTNKGDQEYDRMVSLPIIAVETMIDVAKKKKKKLSIIKFRPHQLIVK